MPKKAINDTNLDISATVSDADLASLDSSASDDVRLTPEMEFEYTAREEGNLGIEAFPGEVAQPFVERELGVSTEMPPMLEPGFDEAPEALMAVSNIEEYSLDDGTVSNHRPVPRINIHVFCETQGVAGLIQNAARDRRLSKAYVELFDGGIKSAISYYSDTSTPNLIIIESHEKHRPLIDSLGQLAMVCDPSTKVVIIGAVNDVRLYRDLMKRGISEYLISPRSPGQIISTVADLYTDPSAEPIGKTYAFIGSRGGAGSSVISHNVAWALSERYSNNTVLMDLDLPFGTASLDFEQDSDQGLSEALIAPERLDTVLLDRLLQSLTDKLSLFAAPNLLDRSYEVKVDAIESVLDVVRSVAPSIIIDIPHNWSSVSQFALRTADEVVLTCTPDLASFRNAKNIVEFLKLTRINDAPPLLVMNQIGMNKASEVPVEQFTSVLGISPFATLQWDPALFGTAVTNGSTVFDVNAKGKAAAALSQIASHLAGYPDESNESGGFSLKSLFKKK